MVLLQNVLLVLTKVKILKTDTFSSIVNSTRVATLRSK